MIGIIWYFQSVASGRFRRGKDATQSDPNLAEVGRLMRDKTTQDLAVAINGHVFRAASELNPGQLRRIHFASKVLAKWLADTPATPLPADTPDTLQAEPSTPSEEWIPAETVVEGKKHDYTPPFMPESGSEVKPVSTQFADVVGGILKPAPAPTETAEFKSIATQIDQILQEMIADTPYEERGITLNDAPNGVMVTLDGKQYLGVKDVPDEEVRNLIRSAVVEWEKTGKFGQR